MEQKDVASHVTFLHVFCENCVSELQEQEQVSTNLEGFKSHLVVYGGRTVVKRGGNLGRLISPAPGVPIIN